MDQVLRTESNNYSKFDFEKTIRSIHDYLYANSEVRTPQKVIDELSKVFSSMIHTEQKNKKNFAFEFSQDELQKLMSFNSTEIGKVSKVIRASFKELKNNKDAISLSDKDIAYIVGLMNGVPLSQKEKDYLGDALESIRTEWVKRHGGQFFTDQKVTSLAINLLDFAPEKGEVFADVCCGTGGFLIAALKYSLNRLDKKGVSRAKALSILEDSIWGHEIDKEVGKIASSTLGGLTMGILENNVLQGDSLDQKKLDTNGFKEDSFDCLAANPPFGVKITIKDPAVLANYDLAKTSLKITPKAPDILLLERNIKLLKPGIGKLAIVLPYQLLSGPQAYYVREWLLRHCQILAVVDLPKETFQPHTGTKTSLVILKRRMKPLTKVSLKNDPPIFMSIPKFIGHDRRGNPVYKKNDNGQMINEILSDIDDVRKDFSDFKNKSFVETEISFTVPGTQIERDEGLRINSEFYSPKHSSSYSTLNNSDYTFVPLRDLVSEISFPGRFKRAFVSKDSNSVPFLGGSNITQFSINTEKWFSKDDSKYKQLRVQKGWLLITRSGTTGIVSSVPDNWDGYAISEHVIRIIPNEKKIPGSYLLAFLKSEYAQKQIRKGVFGSVIDEIAPEHLSEIMVPIPKNKASLRKISNLISEAEEHRSIAMKKFDLGMLEIEKQFGNAFE